MEEATRVNVDRRLARIEGQVKALRRMVGEDRYCIDIAQQVQAARAALSSLESIILDDHIATCVQHALEVPSVLLHFQMAAKMLSSIANLI